MPRITHIALKVDDIEKTSAFYETVFGFQHVNTIQHEGHSDNPIDALRPAWANWRPISAEPYFLQTWMTRVNEASCSSLYKPVHQA